jgi:hypothetical protein
LTANRLGVSDYGPSGGGPNIMSQRPSPARHAAPPLIQTRMIPRTAPCPSRSTYHDSNIVFGCIQRARLRRAGPAKATGTVTGPGGGGTAAGGRAASFQPERWLGPDSLGSDGPTVTVLGLQAAAAPGVTVTLRIVTPGPADSP